MAHRDPRPGLLAARTQKKLNLTVPGGSPVSARYYPSAERWAVRWGALPPFAATPERMAVIRRYFLSQGYELG
jgi:hypothetical protein